MARRGDGDYAGALDRTLEAAAAGVVELSASARRGTGLDDAPAPGWRDHTDVPVVDPEQTPAFRDAARFCESRRQLAAGEENVDVGGGVGRRSEALERREQALRQLAQATGETLAQVIDRLAARG